MRGKPNIRNRFVLLVDLFLIAASIIGSFALRFELGPAFFYYLPTAYWMVGVALLVKPLMYYFFGLYRRVWVYASVQELKVIAAAVTSASVVTALITISLFTLGIFRGLPRSTFVIDWLLSLILVGGLRFIIRIVAENNSSAGHAGKGTLAKQALIIGAGDAGAMVVRELQKNPQLNLVPAGFLDDNQAKLHQEIHGVRVLGTIEDLSHTLDRHRVHEVIIAIPSAPGKVVRKVADVCRLKSIPFRTMPGIYELLGGKVSISRLREVDITDLLRRQPTQMKDDLAGPVLSGRTALVTGAGGSIGRELCRQIARWGPAELIMLGHGENSIFESLMEIHESFPSLPLKPIIADIRDLERIRHILQREQPEVVFHAAAHKHVPMMELNVDEAVTNNVLGTRNVVDASEEFGVGQLVMISTDKAIRPVNVMGATKRMAEMIVLDAALRTGRPYSVVRFGNVLGSRGSVVPLFKRQIARGGPVTVTHPDMKRYFMTIPEAVYLVLQTAGMGKGGETFVLNMGQQVRILDLAEDLIRLSGLEPGRDIEIVFTGIRPGEKLAEDLWEEGHEFTPTIHPEIFRLENQCNLTGSELRSLTDELIGLAKMDAVHRIIDLLDKTIPNAAIGTTPPPDITSIDS